MGGKPPVKRILSIFAQSIIPALWIISIMLLSGRGEDAGKRLEVGEVFGKAPEQTDDQSWAGIYLQDEKIGYCYQSYQNSEKGILFKEYMKMRIPLGGTIREVTADNFALLDSDFSVKSFSSGMTSGDYEIAIHGLAGDGGLEITYISGGKTKHRFLDLDEPLYFQGQVPYLVKYGGFKPGSFSIPVFDPLSMNISDMKIDVGEADVSDGDTLYPLDLELSGIKTTMTIDNEANVIVEEQPGGMMLKSEARETALALKNVYSDEEDFLVKLSVPSDRVIKNPRKTEYLKAELEGIDPARYVLDDNHTQRLIASNSPIVEIDRRNKNKIPRIDLEEYLKPSEFIQSDDSSIMQTAYRITRRIKSDRDMAFAIADWVHENIIKDIAVSVPSAVEVLKVKRGDCNEHTALYTALARAAGIPCKVVIGIVYKDGVFYYHAWPAVYLGYWHHLDPTFGQHIADATHIQLLEGGIEKQTEIVNVVGKLKIKVIDYAYASRDR